MNSLPIGPRTSPPLISLTWSRQTIRLKIITFPAESCGDELIISAENNTNQACPHCKPYLLKWNEEEDFKSKILDLIKYVPVRPLDAKQGCQFKKAVRDLLIFTSKKEDGSDVVTRVADVFSQRHSQILNTPAETVFFWDPDQYEIIKHDKKLVPLKGGKYVIFTGVEDTGL